MIADLGLRIADLGIRCAKFVESLPRSQRGSCAHYLFNKDGANQRQKNFQNMSGVTPQSIRNQKFEIRNCQRRFEKKERLV